MQRQPAGANDALSCGRASVPGSFPSTCVVCTFPAPSFGALLGPLHPPNLASLSSRLPSIGVLPRSPSLWEGPWIPRSPRPSFHCHRHRHRPSPRGGPVPLSGRLSKPPLVGHAPLLRAGRSGSFGARRARAWRSTKWRRRVGAETPGHGRRAVTAAGGSVRARVPCVLALVESSLARAPAARARPAPTKSQPRGGAEGKGR